MTAPIVQIRYDELDQAAARFAQAAERSAELERRLQSAFRPLQEGGWIGRGAAAFESTMQGEIFPACTRLITALETAREVTLQIRGLLAGAEEEAAGVFQGGDSGSAAQNGVSLSVIGKVGQTIWQVFTDRKAWRAFFNGVRFVKDPNGMWRLFGTRAAKEALGVSPYLTRFGQRAIKKNLELFDVYGNLKNVAIGQGPFAERAAKLLKSISTNPPLETAAGFIDRFKGNIKNPLNVLDGVITVASNIYEFGYGAQKDVGIFSRQFATATTADLSASVGIVAASTAIGSMIPVPGLGTAAGFAVGMGLQYVYDTYGKEAWRGAVDHAAQAVQKQAGDAINTISRVGRDVSRAAYDTVGAIGAGATEYGKQLKSIFTGPSPVLRGALGDVGMFRS